MRDRLEGIGAALLQPLVHVVVVELLAPHHSRQGLTHDVGRVGVEGLGNDRCVELVGLLAAGFEDLFKMAAEGTGRIAIAPRGGRRRDAAEPEPNHLAFAGRHAQVIMRGDLRPLLLGIHGLLAAVDDVVVDAVLDVWAAIGDAENALGVRFVFGEEQWHVPLAREVAFSQFGIDGLDDSV